MTRWWSNTLDAFGAGLVDGWREPHDLGVGLTFPDQWHNELYDASVNLGQALGQLAELAVELWRSRHG